MPETYGTGPEYMNSPHVSLIKAQPHSPTQEGGDWEVWLFCVLKKYIWFGFFTIILSNKYSDTHSL